MILWVIQKQPKTIYTADPILIGPSRERENISHQMGSWENHRLKVPGGICDRSQEGKFNNCKTYKSDILY